MLLRTLKTAEGTFCSRFLIVLVLHSITQCCSVCYAGNMPDSRLDVLKGSSRQYHKRRTAVNEISVSLRKKLEMELKVE